MFFDLQAKPYIKVTKKNKNRTMVYLTTKCGKSDFPNLKTQNLSENTKFIKIHVLNLQAKPYIKVTKTERWFV